jgi:thymidylate kinase
MVDSIENNKNFQRAVKEIFIALEDNKIPFCVLRNYEMIPRRIGSDLDLFLSSDNKDQFYECLNEVARKTGCGVIRLPMEKQDPRDAYAFYEFSAENDDFSGFNIDVHYSIEEGGVEYISTETALNSLIRFDGNNVFILKPRLEMIHVFMHGMYGGHHEDRYISSFKKIFEKEGNFKIQELNKIFYRPISRIINFYLVRGRVDRAFKIGRMTKYLFFAKNGMLLRKIGRRFKRLFRGNAKGIFIVFLGPDGAGKTTTAILLAKLIRLCGLSVKHSHLGSRPAILPRRAMFNMGAPRSAEAEKSGYLILRVRDIFRYFYHFFDYLTAYFFNIRRDVNNGVIVIIERYFYDYILAFERKNIGISKKFIESTFRAFMPKPGILFFLFNDAKEIIARRDELTEEQINGYEREVERLKSNNQKLVKVKTDIPPEKVAGKLAVFIFEYLDKKMF